MVEIEDEKYNFMDCFLHAEVLLFASGRVRKHPKFVETGLFVSSFNTFGNTAIT
jgi:hypothetical protein